MMTNRGERESSASRSREVSEVTGGNVVPLNSTKSTGALLKQLATELGVPTTAFAEDLRLLIGGQLRDGGRDPMNVQVVVRKSDEETAVSLRDVEGVFLEAKAADSGEGNRGKVDGSGHEAEGGEGTNVETLKEAQRVMTEEKGVLEEEVGSLKTKLDSMEVRVKEIWQSICTQLAEFVAIITVNDEEIAFLKEPLVKGPQLSPSPHNGQLYFNA